MAKQKFGLGRGLDALIAGASEVMSAQQPSRIDENAILFASIDSIIPNPRQPRRIFRDDDPKLLELSASIKEHGLLQPLVVTHLNPSEMPGGSAKKDRSGDPWLEENDKTSEETAHVVQFQLIAGERQAGGQRSLNHHQLHSPPPISAESTRSPH